MNSTLIDSLLARRRAVSPWAGLYFLQSLLINLALGYPFSLLYTAAFTCLLLLLWRYLPRGQKALLGICSLVAACYFPFGQAYGAPNFNTLLALHSTNMEESSEILTIFPWYSYLTGLFIFALGIIALRRRKEEEQHRMAQLSGIKDSWTVTAVKPRYHIYVVVIGESARRDAMGAFGGHWDNTPFASHVNGDFFMDYIAASGSTQKSLGLTLNRVVDNKPQYQDNFVTLANRAGFQTWWFSNQGQIGEYDTAIASIAKRADEAHFLKNGDFEADKNTRDDALLSMTAQVLATERTQPQLIVLHLMGSHPQACDRTQGKYATFVQSKETSCYLYTMTQTDDLLRQLYTQLRHSGDSFSLVYFSDHGLAFKERGKAVQYLAHDDKFQQNFQVPFMVLSSDSKAHRIIKARRSANDFLSFFSQWTGISAKEIKNRYRFISEQKAGPVYITNFKLQKVDYNHLGSDIFSLK
ncbi:phosphoethanolamine transferase [Salmonella enterica]|nr:phosphoethanolamine transferase [Salmonella enterica]